MEFQLFSFPTFDKCVTNASIVQLYNFYQPGWLKGTSMKHTRNSISHRPLIQFCDTYIPNHLHRILYYSARIVKNTTNNHITSTHQTLHIIYLRITPAYFKCINRKPCQREHKHIMSCHQDIYSRQCSNFAIGKCTSRVICLTLQLMMMTMINVLRPLLCKWQAKWAVFFTLQNKLLVNISKDRAYRKFILLL